jgi:hypothetical protein
MSQLLRPSGKRRKWTIENGVGSFFKKSLFTFTIFYSLFSPSAVRSAPKLAPANLSGETVVDLPAPYNLQAATAKRDVSLSWEWDAPTGQAEFLSFGYEVMRGTIVIAIVPRTAYTDLNVPIGTHTYKIRAKGGSKELGKRRARYSSWSEPASTSIKLTCAGPPAITLKVVPTKKIYGSIPALRLHFTGSVVSPEACTTDKVQYRIDSGLSTARVGPITLDAKGRFDEFIDAMGPEDETITGSATFQISVTAQNEAGGSVSDVFAIDLERENPFAPKQR